MNQILNYQEDIRFAEEHIRLIPYENGILVYDDVHCAFHEPGQAANVMKRELHNIFLGLLQGFRRILTGQYLFDFYKLITI